MTTDERRAYAYDDVMHELLEGRCADSPDRRFLADGHCELTFAQTQQRMLSMAGGLSRLGVQAADRIVLMMPNCVEFVLAWLACARLSAVSVFVNPAYRGEMLDYVLKDAAPAGLITHGDAVANLVSSSPEVLNGIGWICASGAAHKDMNGYRGKVVTPSELCNAAAPKTMPDVDPAAPVCVIYTSGTTGPSKGVVLSSSALLAGTRTFVELAGLTSHDVLYTPLPLFHGLASRQGVMSCLMTGAQVHIGERFSASRFWEEVCRADATIAHTMFNIPAMLKAQPAHPLERAHRLRLMYNANHDEAFEQRFGVKLVESYGLVETGITIYSHPAQRVPGSCGRLHHDWEASIVDADGNPLPDGQAGELLLRPRRAGLFMAGYLNKPQATLDACRDFWFHTGDFLHRDRDGCFYFAGRQKERIRRRGENISAWEIERIVATHPAVRLCAAIGYPAEVGDDDVRLVLTLKPGSQLAPEALARWLRTRLPRFMLPRYIEIVEHLPLTPTEKVRKNELIAAALGPTAWDREAAERATAATAHAAMPPSVSAPDTPRA